MTGRSVTVQGALAAVGLLAAYLTWQRAPELEASETVVLDITKNDLEKVRFEDAEAKSWVELSRGKDDQGPFTYVRLSGHDASNVALPSGHPTIQVKQPERLVRGNESAQRLFERFTPLRATRALGTLDANQLKEFGLDTAKKAVEVSWRGGKRRFAIVPAPPGGSDPYVKDQQDGRVYIVNRQILSDLQAAQTNLLERRFHGFFLEDIDRVVVTAGDKKRELVASRQDEGLPGIRLASADKPTEFDQTARNWHDRVWNLFPSEVLGKDEVPPPSKPVVAIRVDYSSRGRPLGWIEIAKAGAPPASGGAPSSEVYARSEFTAGWMRLPADGASLISEGEALAGRK
jgi:hypothetical protein